jgi:hypothetical protein
MFCLDSRSQTRRALVAGAFGTALFLTSACGTNHAGPATSSSAPCHPLPDSQVPPLQKALTEQSTGTYCAPAGVTLLVVLKAHDFTPARAWAEPDITGPDGGVKLLTAPLTTLRGTTVAAVSLTIPGPYTFTSATPDHEAWQATVQVN